MSIIDDYKEVEPNRCADPGLAISALTSSILDRICVEGQGARDYTDAEITAVTGQLAAIESNITNLQSITSADFQNQLTQLSNLVNSLDLDGDGEIVDQLLTIQSAADSAATAAQTAQTAADTAQQAANAAANSAGAAATAATNAQTTASEALTKVTANDGKISDLQTAVASFVDTDTQIDPEEVKRLARLEICANNNRFADAIANAIANVNSHVCNYTQDATGGDALIG